MKRRLMAGSRYGVCALFDPTSFGESQAHEERSDPLTDPEAWLADSTSRGDTFRIETGWSAHCVVECFVEQEPPERLRRSIDQCPHEYLLRLPEGNLALADARELMSPYAPHHDEAEVPAGDYALRAWLPAQDAAEGSRIPGWLILRRIVAAVLLIVAVALLYYFTPLSLAQVLGGAVVLAIFGWKLWYDLLRDPFTAEKETEYLRDAAPDVVIHMRRMDNAEGMTGGGITLWPEDKSAGPPFRASHTAARPVRLTGDGSEGDLLLFDREYVMGQPAVMAAYLPGVPYHEVATGSFLSCPAWRLAGPFDDEYEVYCYINKPLPADIFEAFPCAEGPYLLRMPYGRLCAGPAESIHGLESDSWTCIRIGPGDYQVTVRWHDLPDEILSHEAAALPMRIGCILLPAAWTIAALARNEYVSMAAGAVSVGWFAWFYLQDFVTDWRARRTRRRMREARRKLPPKLACVLVVEPAEDPNGLTGGMPPYRQMR